MRLLASMLLVLAVACGSDSSTAPVAVIVTGTWTLRTVGGAPLPYVLDRAGADQLELTDAVIIATSAGNFTATSTQRLTLSGQASTQSFTDAGRYVLTGNSVTFTFSSDNGTATGAILGDSLTFSDGGIPVVYRKQ